MTKLMERLRAKARKETTFEKFIEWVQEIRGAYTVERRASDIVIPTKFHQTIKDSPDKVENLDEIIKQPVIVYEFEGASPILVVARTYTDLVAHEESR